MRMLWGMNKNGTHGKRFLYERGIQRLDDGGFEYRQVGHDDERMLLRGDV